MNNFWNNLPKPFFVLAPMEDITDAAFRRVIAKYGKPDVTYTEFASVDGICSEKGQSKILKDLEYDDSERPIVAQLFGSKPENFRKAAKIIANLGFDGIDINMGCPDKAVIKQMSGSALINTPSLAQEIVIATKEGAGETPVSIKTRLGFNRKQIEEWIPNLLSVKPAALTIHGRTKKEMSKVPADWESIGRIAEMARGSGVLIIGNGDIQNIEEARLKAEAFGLDGIMVGRGIFGNPWFFNKHISKNDFSVKDVLLVLCEHTKLFEQLLSSSRHFMLMRKHYASYLKGYQGIKELKENLLASQNAFEVNEMVKKYLEDKKGSIDIG